MKKRIINTILTLTLILAMTVSLTGCIHIHIGIHHEDETTAPFYTRETTEDTQNTQPTSPNHAADTDGIPQYDENFDPQPFYDLCDELTEAAKGKDSAAVLDLYEQVYTEYLKISDMETALYLDYCRYSTNEEISDEYEEFEATEVQCMDAALTALLAICSGPCADDFKKLVGEETFELFAEYEPMTEQELEWDRQETALLSDYYAAMAKADEEGMSDAELNKIVGPIYLDLVKLRNEMAKFYGYANYGEYADSNVYSRDYDSADAERFHEAVKKISRRYYDLLYTTDAYFGITYINASMSTKDCMKNISKYADRIDPVVSETYDYLTTNGLYDIGDESDRQSGAFTTFFFGAGMPFIYICKDGMSDFQTLSHEFGHFINFHKNPSPNALAYGTGSLDLCEIHSNGLEALYSNFYEDIYGDRNAETVRNFALISLLMNVVDGCLFDEFQREVYATENLTLDKVNKIYQDTCREYGDSYTNENDYWWMQVSHNYDAPMYYLSYAASGIVALQIWAQSINDFDGAVKTWRSFIDAGPYKYGYLELLGKLGVKDFTNEDSVYSVCDAALSYIEKAEGSSFGMDDFIDDFGDGMDDFFEDFADDFDDLMP